MAEIDVRRNGNEMVDKIRFTEDAYIFVRRTQNILIESDDGEMNFFLQKEEVPDLIKALQKYLELYGER